MYTSQDHTFVICAYKENPFLESLIESIRNQTVLGNVVISTSTPNSHICELAKKYQIKLLVNPKPGNAGTDWNYGYDNVDTKLVTLAHQDDYYEPSFLESTLKAINGYSNEENILFLYTDYYEIRDNEKVFSNILLRVKSVMNRPFSARFINRSQLAKRMLVAFGDPISCPTVTLVKRFAGESVFDTSYINSCDYQAWVDLALKKGRFVYIPQKLMGHRIYQESATTRNLADNIRAKEDYEIMSTLWPAPIARLINRVYVLSERSNS